MMVLWGSFSAAWCFVILGQFLDVRSRCGAVGRWQRYRYSMSGLSTAAWFELLPFLRVDTAKAKVSHKPHQPGEYLQVAVAGEYEYLTQLPNAACSSIRRT